MAFSPDGAWLAVARDNGGTDLFPLHEGRAARFTRISIRLRSISVPRATSRPTRRTGRNRRRSRSGRRDGSSPRPATTESLGSGKRRARGSCCASNSAGAFARWR
jgi:hypothetical protein